MALRILLDSRSNPHAFDDSVASQSAQITTNLANGWTDVTTTWAPANVMADALAAKLAEFETAYAAAIVADVSYTSVGGVTKTYQADAGSVVNLQATINGCAKTQTTPSGFYWVASDNTQVPFSYADLLALAEVIFVQGAIAFQRLQAAKNAAKAATTYVALSAVQW